MEASVDLLKEAIEGGGLGDDDTDGDYIIGTLDLALERMNLTMRVSPTSSMSSLIPLSLTQTPPFSRFSARGPDITSHHQSSP
jgi:hypothetical protein